MKNLINLVFLELDENYHSADYFYKTGWVNFNELSRVNLNQEKDLFFAVLPENEVLNKEVQLEKELKFAE